MSVHGRQCTCVPTSEIGSQTSRMTLNTPYDKASLELVAMLPSPSSCWGGRNDPPRPVFALLDIKPRPLCILGKRCTPELHLQTLGTLF